MVLHHGAAGSFSFRTCDEGQGVSEGLRGHFKGRLGVAKAEKWWFLIGDLNGISLDFMGFNGI